MSKLIYQPGVFSFTKIQIDREGVQEWLDYNGYKREVEKRLYQLIDDMDVGVVSFGDGLSELFARFCYRAFKSGRPTPEHIYHILESGHGSVFAHLSLTLAIQGVSRTLTHELVRHHVGVNPSQESQRYVDARDINFVVPPLLEWAWGRYVEESDRRSAEEDFLRDQTDQVNKYIREQDYLTHVLNGANPFSDEEKLVKRINEAARCHLPGCAETRLSWTMNLRAARDILGNPTKRGSDGADLEIRRLALRMLEKYKKVAPLIFQDLEEVEMPVVNGIKSKFGGI